MRVSIVVLFIDLALMHTGTALAHDPKNPFNERDPTRVAESRIQNLETKILLAEKAGAPRDTLEPLRFIVRWDTAWPPGADLSVCFWNGPAKTQNYVMNIASVWSRYGNVKFSYSENGKIRICTSPDSADIRVSLSTKTPPDLYGPEDDKVENWSALGRWSRSAQRMSMNLPDVPLAIGRDPVTARHIIRHEFGHALGLAHEHQREECNEWLDFHKIAKYYGWSMEMAISQVGKFTDYDRAQRCL